SSLGFCFTFRTFFPGVSFDGDFFGIDDFFIASSFFLAEDFFALESLLLLECSGGDFAGNFLGGGLVFLDIVTFFVLA
ncbi:hypothetical protein, partial [Salmonella enterica]|uniref:hypothetical protein n=1 Tax=Salmonella enterica TaxID=28901 RepID=UPI0032988856